MQQRKRTTGSNTHSLNEARPEGQGYRRGRLGGRRFCVSRLGRFALSTVREFLSEVGPRLGAQALVWAAAVDEAPRLRYSGDRRDRSRSLKLRPFGAVVRRCAPLRANSSAVNIQRNTALPKGLKPQAKTTRPSVAC